MTSTRTALPWTKIEREVKKATKAYAAEVNDPDLFVINCRFLADFIDRHNDEYPTITNEASFKGLQGRVTMAMNRMQWPRWTRQNKCGAGMKYIVPWGRM